MQFLVLFNTLLLTKKALDLQAQLNVIAFQKCNFLLPYNNTNDSNDFN